MVENIIQTVLASEAATAMTSGAIMLGVLGWIGYQLRALPGAIAALIENQFTVTMSLQYHDQAYHRLDVWLSKQASIAKARNVTVVSWFDPASSGQSHALTAGAGRHVVSALGRWWLIEKRIVQAGAGGADGTAPSQTQSSGFAPRQETLTFTTYGRSQAPLKALLAEAERVFGENEALPRTEMMVWSHGYAPLPPRAKRALDTIYIDAAVKDALIADADAFVARRAWYAERGIPWRRGYMLKGPPGCGKSSLIFALAGRLGLPLFIVNPASLLDDNALLASMTQGAQGVYVMEDVDSVEVLKARPDLAKIKSQAARDDEVAVHDGQTHRIYRDPTARGVTLSGFLNAIDGVGAGEGRILFMTSNTADALDPALMRPGRIDRAFEIGPAGVQEARAMFTRFFPDADAAAFARLIGPRLPMAQADLQNLMLALAETGNPVEAARAEIERRWAA